MARACGSERGGICWEESKEDQGRTEKEGQTKTEMGGLCSGGYGGRERTEWRRRIRTGDPS